MTLVKATFTTMRRQIIVTGPESAGKTSLSQKLAEAFDAVWIPEYARGYLEAVDRKAISEDFPHFVQAINQLIEAGFRQQERAKKEPAIVIQDTSHEILHLWQADKFVLSSLVDAAFKNSRPDVYVLCMPDLPWESDPLREDPHRRQELFLAIRDLLKTSGVPLIEVSGFGESRTKNAQKQLERILR